MRERVSPRPALPKLGVLIVAVELAGTTTHGQVLELSTGAPWSNVRYVRVETVASPSWVAWRELEVLG